MNNPFNMMQAMMNPQQFFRNMMNNSQVMQNPVLRNAVQMGQKGDFKGAEQLARNVCKEKGIDPDRAFNEMLNKFGKR